MATRPPATLQIVARSTTGEWRCQQAPVIARLGKSGRPTAGRASLGRRHDTRWRVSARQRARRGTDNNSSSSGIAPTSVCVARTATFAPRTAGAPLRNHRIYQQLVNAPGCTSPDEWLTSIGDVYGHAAVIGANLDPISGDAPGEPAFAAAIFLHRNSYTSAGVETDQRLRVAGRG